MIFNILLSGITGIQGRDAVVKERPKAAGTEASATTAKTEPAKEITPAEQGKTAAQNESKRSGARLNADNADNKDDIRKASAARSEKIKKLALDRRKKLIAAHRAKKIAAMKRSAAIRKKALLRRWALKKSGYERPIVMLDTQHVGKFSNPADRGAYGYGMAEAPTVERYMGMAAAMLKKEGYGVLRAGYRGKRGEYADRAAYAKDNGADVYFAGHLNAGSGRANFSLVETSSNAKSGSIKLMNAVAKSYRKHLNPSLIKRKMLAPGERGNKCVKTAAPSIPAVILEPMFIDNPGNARQLKHGDGAKKIADAIVESVEEVAPIRK